MGDTLPGFPAFPVIVNVNRRFDRLRILLQVLFGCSPTPASPSCEKPHQTDEVARLLSPLDDQQIKALQQVNGDSDVVALWDALLSKNNANNKQLKSDKNSKNNLG